MADANSSTPPPEQEQPTRSASFDPIWNQADASFLRPSALPLPKAPRAWERQPHSPFARNGKYRKVWKRYELRSQPKTKESAAVMEKKSAMASPRKIVKKRALDAPADPNATPGRKGPKNKAFAPTRWETPRRHSGRIASRKIAPPMFMEKPSPKPTPVDAVSTAAQHHASESSDAEDPSDGTQTHELMEVAQDEATVGVNEEFSIVEDHVPPTEPESVVSQPEVAQEELAISLSTRDTSPQALAAEQESEPETAETSDGAQPDVEAPDVNDTSPIATDVEEQAIRDGIWDADVRSEPEFELTDAGLVESSSSDGTKENEVRITKDESDTIAIPASFFQESHVTAMEAEHAAVDGNFVAGDPVLPHISEAQSSGTSVADVNESEEAATALPEHAQAIGETSVDTIMEEQEEQSTGVSPFEDSLAETKPAAQEEEQPTNFEQLLQADAAQASRSDSGLEDDEVSVSDEEMDETQRLDEDGFTLTELPEADREDATSIPSPSLSTAESPRFSSIADTLTLSLPDRTPPKNRTIKDILEEPASPVDEDTAFLRDFLSRADASKASREAIAPRLESMANRRDSGIVRQALASPRIALERKDPNSPNMANAASPAQKAKSKDSERASDMTSFGGKMLDFSEMTEDLTLEKTAPEPTEASETTSNPQSTRRSSRARQTRLPATSSASTAGPNRIQFRRADGTDPVVLKKTEAQELANLTRNNTRRNKGTALAAPIRLNKLKAESLKAGASPGAPSPNGSVPLYANPEIEVYQASKLRWDQQLVYFQEQDNLAGLTSLSDDELAGPADVIAPELAGKNEDRKRKDKSSTSTPARTKRARGLGTGNGTPAKSFLAPASLLPAEVQAETQEAESSKTSGKKSSSKSAKSSTGIRGKKADKPAAIPPAPAAPSSSDSSSSSSKIPSPSSSAEQPSSSSTAPAAAAEPSTAQPAPSQLPTPSSIGQSRRSRLQTPRKIKLPVPVSAAASTPAPTTAAAQTQTQNASRIIGPTPKKMPIAKPAAVSTGVLEANGGNGGQGLSAGRRAGAGRRL